MDPNSQNQRWSLWTFSVFESGKRVPEADVVSNAGRWLREGFGSAGVFRVLRRAFGWAVECKVEGVAAHDRAYVQSVREQFQKNFVEKGWGPLAFSTTRAMVLAGSSEDGTPAAQWVELPPLKVNG